MLESKTAYDLVSLALREIGVIALGDNIADNVAQEALVVLNSLRAEYSLTVKNNEVYDETFFPTAGTMSITLGTDGVTPGDIPTRPAKITQVILLNGVNGVNIPLTIKPYEQFRTQSLQNIVAVPNTAYIDTEYPYRHVWFYPGLNVGWGCRVMGLKYMTEYESLQDPYFDPPEYFSIMYLSLALRMAPKYGVELPDGVLAQCKSALKAVRNNNLNARLKTAANGLKTPAGSSVNFFSGLGV